MPDFAHVSVQRLLMLLTLPPILLACLFGLSRFRRLPLNLRYLTVLTAFVLPLNTWAMALMLRQQNNLFLMPFYTVGEFSLLVVVFAQTIRSRWFTRLAVGLALGFAAYVLVDTTLGPGLTRFRPGQQVVQGLLVLLLVALYFRQLLSDLQVQRLGREPMFWVASGLLVYVLGYLHIALFSDYLLRYSSQLNKNIWAIHSLLFIGLYACYCRALWLSPAK